MRILLDTNAFLWAASAQARLAPHRALIERASTSLIVSVVCSWEIAIKWSLGRLELPEPPERYVPTRIHTIDAAALPIEQVHALAVAELPLHHRDPFDRLLIAQARALGVPILTADRAFQDYDVELLFIG